jgi:hypothetical protein
MTATEARQITERARFEASASAAIVKLIEREAAKGEIHLVISNDPKDKALNDLRALGYAIVDGRKNVVVYWGEYTPGQESQLPLWLYEV